jgi:hypothetical protein
MKRAAIHPSLWTALGGDPVGFAAVLLMLLGGRIGRISGIVGGRASAVGARSCRGARTAPLILDALAGFNGIGAAIVGVAT